MARANCSRPKQPPCPPADKLRLTNSRTAALPGASLLRHSPVQDGGAQIVVFGKKFGVAGVSGGGVGMILEMFFMLDLYPLFGRVERTIIGRCGDREQPAE